MQINQVYVMKPRRLIQVIAAAIPAAVGVITTFAVIQMATPSTEAVKLRNSLIFETIDVSSLQWNPPHYPASFKLDRQLPPPSYTEAIAHVFGANRPSNLEFSHAAAIGRHLAVDNFVGGKIQSDAVSSLRGIVDHGAGYCADFAQVYNGLAHTLSLPVREWGMSFGGFNGDGHSFNEVFDSSLDRWVFIDSYFSFYVVDQNNGEPLSVLDFRERLLAPGGRASIVVVPLSEDRFLFGSREIALDYYQRGANEFYVWWGNNLFEYDRSTPVSLAGTISRSIEQAVAILTGIHPEIRILRTHENEAAILALERTRSEFLFLAVTGALAYGVAFWQVLVSTRRLLIQN